MAVDAVEQVVEGDVSFAAAVERIGSEVWADFLAVDAGEESAGPEVMPVEAASLGGEILFTLAAVIALIPFIVLLTLLGVVRKAVDSLPLGLGRPVGGIITHLIGWAHTLLYDFLHGLETVAGWLWQGVKWLVLLAGVAVGLVTIQQAEQIMGRATARLSRADERLQREIHGINHTLYGPHGLMDQQRATAHDVGYINRELGRLWTRLNGLTEPSGHPGASQLQRLTRELYVLQTRVETIEHELHAPAPRSPITPARIRADEHRIATVETEVQRLTARLEHLQLPVAPGRGLTAQQAHELHHASAISAALAPLVALAPFAGVALLNLSDVLDGRCACVPNMLNPELVTDALIADQVLLNGL